jgi:hypothetical protein
MSMTFLQQTVQICGRSFGAGSVVQEFTWALIAIERAEDINRVTRFIDGKHMRKTGSKTRLILPITLSLALLVYLCIITIKGIKSSEEDIKNVLPYTYIMPAGDSGLIKRKYLSKLKVDRIIHLKGREPISVYLFDNSFHLVINKIDLLKDASLNNILNVAMTSVDRTTGRSYLIIDLGDSYKFQCQTQPIRAITQIFLTLAGDSLRSAVNDSTIGYHLLCKNFSIRYQQNESIDLYLVGEEKALGFTDIIPLDLVLLKRGSAVYFILLTPDDPKTGISLNTLCDIIE